MSTSSEFWDDLIVDRSWDVLISLAKEIDFILIGGWAVYLHTKAIKSKDIDIIVDFEGLEKLKLAHGIKKTDFLKKYETKINEISVDIYVPFYSKFIIPAEAVKKNTIRIEGFKVPKPEILLILKQQAELARKDSIKGQKDRVDILNLLLNSGISLKNYIATAEKYGMENYPRRLKEIVRGARSEFSYLGIEDARKIKMLKEKILREIR
ncbi:MAG: hypothetical protein HYW26_00200 [Candidatus Aenigmarchaeota archaeon]|nr:hypothetical protein [Candidatus Aenigmarchaeota archaeon]